MELSKEDVNTFFNNFQKVYSLNIFFNKTIGEWDVSDFDKFIQVFGNKINTLPEELIVSNEESIQLIIEGTANISKYCLLNNFTNLKHKWNKYIIHANELFLPNDFPLNIEFKSIEDIDASIPQNIDHWENTLKKFMIRKKFVVKMKEYDIYMTLTRESKELGMNMKTTNVINSTIKYEFYLKYKDYSRDKFEITKDCVSMTQMLAQQNYPIAKTQQNETIVEYMNLVNTITFKKLDKPIFMAPKPHTLERKNLVEPGPNTYGIISILENYTITEKADGERMLLFINSKGKIFLINNTLDVSYSGLEINSKKLFNTLIDGEYIYGHQRIDGKKKRHFCSI